MSETAETATQGGAETPAEPAAPDTEAPAPAETGAAATEATETKESPRPSRDDRRWAVLSAKLSAAEQERGRMAAELDAMRRQANPAPEEPQLTPEQQAFVDRRVQQEVAQREEKASVARFHEAGRQAFPDWQDRCDFLLAKGADQQLASLLVDAPDGVQLAAALADDPDELKRITGIRSVSARAIALGKFAATLTDKPATPSRAVSKAPPPIKPISSGTARTEFNQYDPNLSTAQLLAFYAKPRA